MTRKVFWHMTQKKKKLRPAVSLVATAAVLAGSGIAFGPAAFAAGGSGGDPGGGGNTDPGLLGLNTIYYDDPFAGDPKAPSTYPQGVGADSVNFMLNHMGVPAGGNSVADSVWISCNAALANANQRAIAEGDPNPVSRVVAIQYGHFNDDPTNVAGRGAGRFYDATNDWYHNQGGPGIVAAPGSGIPSSDIRGMVGHLLKEAVQLANPGVDQSEGSEASWEAPWVNSVCVALNSFENAPPPVQTYNMNLTTIAQAPFSLAGTTDPVWDSVQTWAWQQVGDAQIGTGTHENLNATIALNWDGDGSNAAEVRTKPMVIDSSTEGQMSPEFLPTDFGWDVWPAGKFWFDVVVEEQGTLTHSINTPDRHPDETWDAAYELTIETDAQNTFERGGGTEPVWDAIHASIPNALNTVNLEANVILHFDGNDAQPAVSSTKPVTITSNGTTQSPQFVPSDLGFDRWPSIGDFWFDIQVPQQHLMAAAVDTPDRDPRESWGVNIESPTKEIFSGEGDDRDILSPDEGLAAGQFYTAEVTAESLGYSNLKISDVIYTDQVFIGSKTADLVDAVYVTDAAGNPIDSATVTIDRSTAGQVTVTGELSDLPATSAQYKLVVPTYVLPSGENYEVPDGSAVCYAHDSMGTGEECIEGDERVTRKITPTPDKVWTLDETGSLTVQDRDWTNNVGADQLTFMPGSSVAAVVNGRIPARLAENLSHYSITDDWSDAAEYVDLSDASKVKVWYEDAPGSGTFTDVTAQFDITVNGTVTTATANSEFLAGTKGLGGDRIVKLGIFGAFKTGYDTGGEKVQLNNAGSEQWNEETRPTNEPPIFTWTPSPDKEDLNTDLEDIDGKTVTEGDTILYRLTLDGGPARAELAGDVFKLGMVDDFDEAYLALTAGDIAVLSKDDGADFTDRFNIQVIDGVAYIFAKVDGEQPTDLKAYAEASIDPETGTIIDQSLLGRDYWITLKATVTQETDGYVIENQAEQLFDNSHRQTRIVYNPLKDIDPDKDVVVEAGSDDSINEGEVELYSLFNYRLNSSEIPAERAYDASEWMITDTFNPEFDSFTGKWSVYAQTDVYDGDELVFATGDLIQSGDVSPAVVTPTPLPTETNTAAPVTPDTVFAASDMFRATFDAETHTFVVEAAEPFLALVNSRPDLPQAWSAYTQMERIAPSERVENEHVETYNGHDRDSNVVWTHTPHDPALEVEKYTLHEGEVSGDRDSIDDPYTLSAEERRNGVNVGFKISNVGNVPLAFDSITDKTHDGTFGTVDGILCDVVDGDDTIQVTFDQMVAGVQLDVDETVYCVGTLEGLTAQDRLHSDTITVDAHSIFDESKKVSDDDPWHAQYDSGSHGVISGFGFNDTNMVQVGVGAGLILLAGAGLAYAGVQRHKKKGLVGAADDE